MRESTFGICRYGAPLNQEKSPVLDWVHSLMYTARQRCRRGPRVGSHPRHRRATHSEDRQPVISPADIFCLAIAAGLMLLEANRGIVPAAIDFLGVLIGLILARLFYVALTDQMQPSSAYLLLVAGVILLTALLSIIVSRRLEINVTEVEAAIGAALGLGTALTISFALFEWLSIRYGVGTPLVKNSLLYWAMSEAAGVRVVAEFFGRLLGK